MMSSPVYRVKDLGSTGPSVLYHGQSLKVALSVFDEATWSDAKCVEQQVGGYWCSVVAYYASTKHMDIEGIFAEPRYGGSL